MCAHRTNLAERTAASSPHMTVLKSLIARRSKTATSPRSRAVTWALFRLRQGPIRPLPPLVRRAPNFAKYIYSQFSIRFFSIKLNILNWLSKLFEQNQKMDYSSTTAPIGSCTNSCTTGSAVACCNGNNCNHVLVCYTGYYYSMGTSSTWAKTVCPQGNNAFCKVLHI